MKLHSNFIEETDVRKAASIAGVGFTRFGIKGSRKRDHAFDVILNGHSGRRQNFGGPDEAAAWDEWGHFLGLLFDLDPDMWTDYYQGAEHFHWSTGGRFRDAGGATTCRNHNHRWEWTGQTVTGSYVVHECRNPHCDAIRRFMTRGTFADLTPGMVTANG